MIDFTGFNYTFGAFCVDFDAIFIKSGQIVGAKQSETRRVNHKIHCVSPQNLTQLRQIANVALAKAHIGLVLK